MFKEPKSPHSHWVASLSFSHFGLRSVMFIQARDHMQICGVCLCVDANVLHRSPTVSEPFTESESFLYIIWSECVSVYVCARVSERDDVYMIHKQVYVQ